MGFRTSVILFNDRTSEWEKDPDLGRKISAASHGAMGILRPEEADIGYGRVIECCHADQNTLGVIHSYNFLPLAHSHWHSGQKDADMSLALLKEAADKLGFRLVKKS